MSSLIDTITSIDLSLSILLFFDIFVLSRLLSSWCCRFWRDHVFVGRSLFRPRCRLLLGLLAMDVVYIVVSKCLVGFGFIVAGIAFCLLGDLTKHVKHLGKRNFVCLRCLFAASTQRHLNKHRYCMLRPFGCNLRESDVHVEAASAASETSNDDDDSLISR